MSTSGTAVGQLVALATGLAESASPGQMRLCPFERCSTARSEEAVISAAGITDDDVTCMFTVRWILDSYICSATEHIRAAAVLMGSDGPITPVLPIAALSRISCEASGVAFWLSDPDLGWEGRLKRCNKLQFKMNKSAMKGLNEFYDLVQTTWVSGRVESYQDEITEVLEWANRRGWSDHQGNPPSRKNWTEDIPSFTHLMRELVESSGEPGVLGQIIYSVSSGVTHSNPLLVGLAYDLTPAAHECSAALKIKTALRCYRLLGGWCQMGLVGPVSGVGAWWRGSVLVVVGGAFGRRAGFEGFAGRGCGGWRRGSGGWGGVVVRRGPISGAGSAARARRGAPG